MDNSAKAVAGGPRQVEELTPKAAGGESVLRVFLRSKVQSDSILIPEGLPPDVIISSDTRRTNRIPPGQSRTKKWPILDASGAPGVARDSWALSMGGLVAHPAKWNWEKFWRLPRVKVFADFHCVTCWSRLGNVWEGVSTKTLVKLAGGLLPDAKFALVQGYDSGWTTNLPVAELLADDALVAALHDGEPISPEHGGPARLIVPRLYAWKSAKWVENIEFLNRDKAGFWERNGCHMHGGPWQAQRPLPAAPNKPRNSSQEPPAASPFCACSLEAERHAW